MKAIWNGKTIAESNETINIEGNHYFPRESVDQSLLNQSETHTGCHWKGTASYFDVVVAGQVNKDAAWYYPDASEMAKNIENYIAFWRGVEVSD